ncbi:thermonuclease family protein [Arthrobacter castelli]|uniref:thermonuclease family protein n=1 Tax=Arthrobacter castelli TaxID=271431 RepID=UPI00041AD721|nr:thermonuclease family protein [Arthrobacter castelli]
MKPISRLAAALLTSLLAIIALSGCSIGLFEDKPTTTTPPTDQRAQITTEVVRVIDGDTVAVKPVAGVLEATNEAGDEHSVRLLGIDTAEMNTYETATPECGAQAATDHLKTMLDAGTAVTLTYDDHADHADHTDRYGRSLTYLSTDGGGDVALRQISAGYAVPWYPDGEPEPQRFGIYSTAADKAEAAEAGAYAYCTSIGRS